MPLVINKATGVKFGKSEDGAVWLDPTKTTPTQFYQFWINTDDADVEDYLKTYTLLSKDEIEQVMAQQQQDPSQRAAQKKLAEEVTKLVHGEEAVNQAKEYSVSISQVGATLTFTGGTQTVNGAEIVKLTSRNWTG